MKGHTLEVPQNSVWPLQTGTHSHKHAAVDLAKKSLIHSTRFELTCKSISLFSSTYGSIVLNDYHINDTNVYRNDYHIAFAWFLFDPEELINTPSNFAYQAFVYLFIILELLVVLCTELFQTGIQQTILIDASCLTSSGSKLKQLKARWFHLFHRLFVDYYF